jgi:hypothetical protein
VPQASPRAASRRAGAARGAHRASAKRTAPTSAPAPQARKNEVSDSYAKALVDLASEKSQLEPIHADIDAVASLLKENAKLRELLYNPIIEGDKKRAVVEKIAKEAGFNKYTVNFMNLLIRKDRMALLDEICESFEEQYCKLTDTQVGIGRTWGRAARPAARPCEAGIRPGGRVARGHRNCGAAARPRAPPGVGPRGSGPGPGAAAAAAPGRPPRRQAAPGSGWQAGRERREPAGRGQRRRSKQQEARERARAQQPRAGPVPARQQEQHRPGAVMAGHQALEGAARRGTAAGAAAAEQQRTSSCQGLCQGRGSRGLLSAARAPSPSRAGQGRAARQQQRRHQQQRCGQLGLLRAAAAAAAAAEQATWHAGQWQLHAAAVHAAPRQTVAPPCPLSIPSPAPKHSPTRPLPTPCRRRLTSAAASLAPPPRWRPCARPSSWSRSSSS